MKTNKLTKTYMEKRISRYSNLEPLPIQLDETIPQAGKDIVYARKLLSIIGLDPAEGKTPINSGAPITGAGGITITLAKCPAGQGPGLHNHLATFETFTVLEGEFLIKSYWDYNVNTLIAKQQKVRKNSVDTYKRGDLYGLYVPETDWYFINMLEASRPLFNSSVTPPAKTINSLVVTSIITESGQTKYNIQGLSDPIVSYNGNVLAKDLEYRAVVTQTGSTTGSTVFTPYVELLFEPLAGQMMTYAYVKNGQVNDLLADLYIVEGAIKSGATGTQLETDRVFYNTTEGKYEFYLISISSSDVVLSVNGSLLASKIEYFQSFSNSRRIVLVEPLNDGDVIEAFYVPTNAINGGIDTNSPQISWSIDTAPLTLSGKFTVQFTKPEDINYENVVYSEVVDYIIGQKTYNKMITLTNAVAGDKFIYRVVNEKFYTPIIGNLIYSVNYSFTNKVEVLNNSGENY